MALSPTELQTMLDDLKRAKYSGQMSVRFADREIRYNSVADMQRAIADLEAELATAAGTRPAPFSLAVHSRD